MKTAVLSSSTAPVYSNATAFHLMEDLLLGISSGDIGRALKVFHVDAEFRPVPTESYIGTFHIEKYLQRRIEKLQSFHFKIKQVTYDLVLLRGSAVIEYEEITVDGPSKKVYEIATFEVMDDLIIHYIGSPTILDTWNWKM